MARWLLGGAAVAGAYVAAAGLGFRLAFAAEQITTVWAPTGIGIAALFLGGLRLWPAVWLGALLANAGTSAPLWTALLIASGNTLEAVAAVAWLRRRTDADGTFRRVGAVVAFVVVAAILCTAISATVGVTTLSVAGIQPWHRFPALWFSWWLGDALGAVVVAPAILAVATHRWSRSDGIRAVLWTAASMAVTHFTFGPILGASPHPIEYVVFPLAMGAALAGGPAFTALVVLGASIVAIWHTARGTGPFASAEAHDSLILLQAFTGILAATSLLLAAAIAERVAIRRREQESADALREQQDLLRLAQRAGGVATFEWDFRNQTARCSAEFFALLGLPAEDGVMTGAEWSRFVHAEDRAPMAAHLARALEGAEPAAADYRIVTANGETRWLTYAGQVRRTPAGDRMIGTVVDVSDRKRLEAELRRHGAAVERILESIGEGFVAFDLDFRYVYVNASAALMLGRAREELVGRTPWEAFDDETTRDWKRMVESASRSGSPARFEVRIPALNRWFENRVYPSATGASLFFADVTARVDAEMALREAKSAAESANELKDQFLATLSHELRTPLNAILGYARLLQTNTIPPEKRDRAIEVIERNAVAQNRLVEDLLDMSRITTGKVRLDPQPLPVVTVLREAVDGVKPAADAKGIALETELDPFAGVVRADAARLQQVFWNVLTNAVKFTGRDGRVTATLRRADDHVEIAVSDTGAGIADEFLPFVFEPFRQAEGRFDRGHGGLGLGLAITKQLVELHGGSIRVASAGLGHGATFTIELPCARSDEVSVTDGGHAGPDGLPSPGAAAVLDGVDVVLVDDEADTLTMFRDALEHAGARVRPASSATAALREIERDRPDLLVTDLGMPGMDGYELLRALRTDAAVPAFPAVAVSAYARPDDRSRSQAAGFQAHLSKPIDPTALVQALSRVLSATP